MSDHDCIGLTNAVQAAYDKHLDALRDEIQSLVEGSHEDTLHAMSQLAFNLRGEADVIGLIVDSYFPPEEYDPDFDDAPTPLFTPPISPLLD